MTVLAIVNTASGSVPADGQDQLQAALKDLRVDGQVIELDLAKEASRLNELVLTRPKTFIVWGGDGTIATALNATGVDGPPVLALPGGTMNMIHKAIHKEDLDWRTCLEKGLRGVVRHIPAISVEGHVCYVAAFIGRLTKLNDLRESVREGAPLEGIRKVIDEKALVLEGNLNISALEDGQTAQSLSAAAAAIILSSDGSKNLDVAAIDPDSPMDFIWTSLRALAGDWRNTPSIDRLSGRVLSVSHADGEALYVTLDGEPRELPDNARFERLDRAARVLSAAID